MKENNDMIAIKPYYYMREGLLHKRVTYDYAVELSEYEVSKVKDNFAHNPSDKQRILAKEWDLQTQMVGKEPFDGIARVNENIRNNVNRKYSVNYDERMRYLREEFYNGSR